MDALSSSPKRVTRARAAARSATSGTAASAARATKAANTTIKSRTTRAASTTSAPSISSTAAPAARTSVKRKTRADDPDEDNSEVESAAKRQLPSSRAAPRATRGPGRPKKNVELMPEPPVTAAPTKTRATRGRSAKKVAMESDKDEAIVPATRTRAKNAQAGDHENNEDIAQEPQPGPVKKTRGRPAGSVNKIKKTVTFAEPDKENVIPVATASKSKAAANKSAEVPAAASMRAKPIRKAAATTTRATRTNPIKKRVKDTEKGKAPMPLSPKKVTQLSVNRDRDVESEDELAMDKPLAKPFQHSPVKPPVSSTKPAPKSREEGQDEDVSLVPAEPATLLGSPVRRPPASPFKNAMKSPAKRIDGLQLGLPVVKESAESSASPFKASLFQSPAKRLPMPQKSVDLDYSGPRDATLSSPFKQSLFQSPAKRGFSPCKPAKAAEEHSDIRSPAPTPVLLCSPLATKEQVEVECVEEGMHVIDDDATDEEGAVSPSRSDFNGRMSTLLPRDADPTLTGPVSPAEELAHDFTQDDDCETVVLEETIEEHMAIVENPEVPVFFNPVQAEADDAETEAAETETQTQEVDPADISTTPPNSPPQQALDMFSLRQQDLVTHENSFSESEDDLTHVVTPHSISPVKQMRGSIMRPRTSGFGFTPLASHFGEWQAGSPIRTNSLLAGETPTKCEASPANEFFEAEMGARSGDRGTSPVDKADPPVGTPEIQEPVCDDISITEEDLALAAEADEMSTMSPNQVEAMLDLDSDDSTMSDASQEYGDENEVPGQNANGNAQVPPVTPKRFIRREFHTVSKVPLKAADFSTPPPQPSLKKRRHSISKISASRPTHTLSRSATVISYSPTKNKERNAIFEEAVEEESMTERSASLSPPRTPGESEVDWTNPETPVKTPVKTPAKTPAMTPRRHPALLRGAIVFVDVRTMEGEDANAIFVELLTQMGARCVKSWNWNSAEEDASAKIGITHVVFKDGGKRTMERVRESKGVVQCVGVGWVLE